jgi:hypothetical protein
MIIKIQINKDTLEVTTDNYDCIINYIKEDENMIELEISIPEPDNIYPYFNTES